MLSAQLEAYDLDNNAVSFMRSYLINRLQRCKINNFFSERAKISAGVYKDLDWVHYFSISSSITYIFLFLQKYDQPNYADDSIMYASDKRVSIIIDLPRHEFTILSNGFTMTSCFSWCWRYIANQHGMWWWNCLIKTQNRKKC